MNLHPRFPFFEPFRAPARLALLALWVVSGTLAAAGQTLQALWLTKLKVAAGLVLALALLVTGASLIVRATARAEQGGAQAEDRSAAPDKGAELPRPERRVRLDRYGDPLPPGALARLGTTRLRPGDAIRLLTCLADGKSLLCVASEEEGTPITTWDLATGKLLRRSAGPPAWRLDSAALAPDGQILVVAGYARRPKKPRVLLWDVPAGKELRLLAETNQATQAVAFAPDGKTVAAAADNVIRLWDVATGTEVRRCRGTQDLWTHLAFSPNGQTLASGSWQSLLRLWDVATGRELKSLDGHTGRIAAIVFSPDGRSVATAAHQDKTVRLWDRATGKELRRFVGERGTSSLAFTPDGKTLVSGDSREDLPALYHSPIRLWDVATGRERRRCDGHLFGVRALAFTPDGRKLVSGGGGTALRVHDTATGQDLLPFPEHASYVNSVVFAPDGRTVATGGLDGAIRLWETASGKPLRLFTGGHGQRVWRLAFSPDGHTLASAGHDGTIRFWDPRTGREISRLPAQFAGGAHAVEYAPDGRTLVSADRGATVQLWDAATHQELRRTAGGGGFLGPRCFSPDGKLLAGVTEDLTRSSVTVRLWETATGRELRKWPVADEVVVAFSPDGRRLAGAENFPGRRASFFHLWDLATGKDSQFVVPQQARTFCLAFAPDGRTLAWGTADGTLVLWELAAGQVRRRLPGHLSIVTSLAFSPDGKVLASGDFDTTALLWDMTGAAGAAGPRPANLSAEDLRRLWADLAAPDAARAYQAIGTLTAFPGPAVLYLRKNLRPAVAGPEPVARLLADLDSPRFAVREKATQELQKLGERAEPAFRQGLEGRPSPEVRRRLEQLLDRLEVPVGSPEQLRSLRALEVLERIGTVAARQVLETLAQGAPGLRLTREAKAALERLARP